MSELKKLILVASLSLGLPALQGAEDPRALLLQARGRQRQGQHEDLRAAAALYRRTLELAPGSAEAHLRLSECLLELGEVAEATAEAEKAVELGPASGEAWAHLGVLRHVQSRNRPELLPKARQALTQATRLIPQDVELWFRLGDACDSLRDDPQALRAWSRLGRLHPAAQVQGQSLESFAWEKTVAIAERLRLYEPRREAIMALATPLQAPSRHLKMLEDLAREQAEQGFLGHAEESFLLLEQHVPKEPGIWENIALVRLRANDFAGALASLQQAEALRPRPRNSYYMGLCLLNLGRTADAEASLKPLLEGMQDEDAKAIVLTARELLVACALMQGRPRQALDLVAQWEPETRTSARFQSMAFVARVRLNDLKGARTLLREGMTRFKGQEVFGMARTFPPGLFGESWSMSGRAKRALRQLEREITASHWAYFQQWGPALEAIQEALRIAPPRSAEILLLQANAYDQLGRWKEALATLREAQRLDPNSSTLQNNLGYLLMEHGGDLQEAAGLIQAALQQEPSNGSTLDSWGWVLFRQGKLQEAETILRKAAELNPFSPETRMHLGEVLLKLDRDQEALEQWERALAHAFPERRELERKVRDLRVRISKRATAGEGPLPEEAAAEAADEEEELP